MIILGNSSKKKPGLTALAFYYLPFVRWLPTLFPLAHLLSSVLGMRVARWFGPIFIAVKELAFELLYVAASLVSEAA